ncbi:50S ribosomal protein L3 [Candidatus Phytoplasma oryzae]|uniref:Large ribosomal subunit protein uL3 n=1 Tax=Candidatus Phytoplasma oryzae TaxID=203274 RepID=A0A328IRC4_9MOLU|nr:50S ribosomal protein L3 [Candidatus Phytoplasma oryzae]RAM57786.1 50S ribosomal protein L3 [Candidatus Phytoplasma oryzae]
MTKKGILGKKIGMTQIFDDKGFAIPVTVIDVADNIVLQQKTIEKDGYLATQLGFGYKKKKSTTKPLLGHFNKVKSIPKYFIKEIFFHKYNKLSEFQEGQKLEFNDFFKSGDIVDVIGFSKGKGFSGCIKRHNQKRGPETHGSRYHRRPGSMGPIKGNIKGKKLPGQMGNNQVTLQNLQIIDIDNIKKIFLIKGSVPGPNKSCVIIKSAFKQNIRELENA